MGNDKKVAVQRIRTDADPEQIRVTKRLVSADAFEDIRRLDDDNRRWMHNNCLNAKDLRSGLYLVPTPFIEKVEERLERYKAERQILIDNLIEAYPDLVIEAHGRLKSLFDAEDYLVRVSETPVFDDETLNPVTDWVVDEAHPDGYEKQRVVVGVLPNDGTWKERLRSAYGVDHYYLAWDTPDTLKTISKELFEKEQERHSRQWMLLTAEIQMMLRQEVKGLIDELNNKLTNTNAKGTILLQQKSLDKVNEYIDVLNSGRNITNDEELKALTERVRNLLEGTDAKAIRSDEDLRQEMSEAFGKFGEELAQMVDSAPTRAFFFEEDEG